MKSKIMILLEYPESSLPKGHTWFLPASYTPKAFSIFQNAKEKNWAIMVTHCMDAWILFEALLRSSLINTWVFIKLDNEHGKNIQDITWMTLKPSSGFQMQIYIDLSNKQESTCSEVRAAVNWF